MNERRADTPVGHEVPERVPLQVGQAVTLLVQSGENVIETEHELLVFLGIIECANTLVVVEKLARKSHGRARSLQAAFVHDPAHVLLVCGAPESFEAFLLRRRQRQAVGIHRQIAAAMGYKLVVLSELQSCT
jgi:hypothetical protein